MSRERLLPNYRYQPGMPLTVREEEVLFALADGLTNKEIGEEFFITDETVKMHMKGVLIKLEAKNRTHAVAIAYHRGILVVPE